MARNYVAQLLPDQEQADILVELLAGEIIKDDQPSDRVTAVANLLADLTKQMRDKRA